MKPLSSIEQFALVLWLALFCATATSRCSPVIQIKDAGVARNATQGNVLNMAAMNAKIEVTT